MWNANYKGICQYMVKGWQCDQFLIPQASIIKHNILLMWSPSIVLAHSLSCNQTLLFCFTLCVWGTILFDKKTLWHFRDYCPSMRSTMFLVCHMMLLFTLVYFIIKFHYLSCSIAIMHLLRIYADMSIAFAYKNHGVLIVVLPPSNDIKNFQETQPSPTLSYYNHLLVV